MFQKTFSITTISPIEDKFLKKADLPLALLEKYLTKYKEPFEAWANFVADYDGDYWGKIWNNLKDYVEFGHCEGNERKRIEHIRSAYFGGGQYFGFQLPSKFLDYHRLKINVSGHFGPDFDSLGSVLAVAFQLFQCPNLGHSRVNLTYQGELPQYVVDFMDDLILGENRGTRSFVRKLFNQEETYAPVVKDVMTLYKDSRRVSDHVQLSTVINAMKQNSYSIVNVVSATDRFLGAVREAEVYKYYYYLYEHETLQPTANVLLLKADVMQAINDLESLQPVFIRKQDHFEKLERICADLQESQSKFSELLATTAWTEDMRAAYAQQTLLVEQMHTTLAETRQDIDLVASQMNRYEQTLKKAMEDMNSTVVDRSKLTVAAYLRWKENFYGIKPLLARKEFPESIRNDDVTLLRYFEKSMFKEGSFVCAERRAVLKEKITKDFREDIVTRDILIKLIDELPDLNHRVADTKQIISEDPNDELHRLLDEYDSLPVVHNGLFKGLITRKHLQKTGVFVYMVDTQDWKKLKGVTLKMVLACIDHHERTDSLPQDLNLAAYSFAKTGAMHTLVVKEMLACRDRLYWPKQMLLVSMATILDDTKNLNVEEKKAEPVDVEMFRSLVIEYFKDEEGFNPRDDFQVSLKVAQLQSELWTKIYTYKQRQLARDFVAARLNKDALVALLGDTKFSADDIGDRAQAYAISQMEGDLENYAAWNEVDFKDWLAQNLLRKTDLIKKCNYDKENIVYFTTADAPHKEQYDEVIVYTQTPGKMFALAKQLLARIKPLGAKKEFKREEIQAYRRLRTDLRPSDKLIVGHAAEHILAQYGEAKIKQLFFISYEANGINLSLKKEVPVSEGFDNLDLDLVIEIIAKYCWHEQAFDITLVKANKAQYQQYVDLLYNANMIILKYPPATLTSRKRQIEPQVKQALAVMYSQSENG